MILFAPKEKESKGISFAWFPKKLTDGSIAWLENVAWTYTYVGNDLYAFRYTAIP
jgi:hypothetical protein